MGVYYSRLESIINAKANYINLMDPDDMLLNGNLFQNLYNYNLNNNFDIIEYSVFQQIEGKKRIFFPNNHFENHYHNFPDKIINQPYLSNLLYYLPGTKDYSYTICRNIWNKMIKKKLFLDMNNYMGNEYLNKIIITTDDMIMNIIIYQFAQNYSNIELPGYLYIIRKVSMSHGEGGIKLNIIRAINYYYYFKFFYRYIKQYNKNRNYLFYEMKNLKNNIMDIKYFNITEYILLEIKLIKEILEDPYSSQIFKDFLTELLMYFK